MPCSESSPALETGPGTALLDLPLEHAGGEAALQVDLQPQRGRLDRLELDRVPSVERRAVARAALQVHGLPLVAVAPGETPTYGDARAAAARVVVPVALRGRDLLRRGEVVLRPLLRAGVIPERQARDGIVARLA